MTAISHQKLKPISGDRALDARAQALSDIIRAAGALAQAAFETGAGGFEMKGPQDFLTETDAAVEALVRNQIAQRFPEDGFVGEESGSSPAAMTWVVDPIDGTANFARRIPHYCISIALVSAEEVLLGAIYDPAHDELYFARKGHGATRNQTAISVSSVSDPQAACVELGWSTRIANRTYLDTLGQILSAGPNVRRAASGALGLAYVADGRSDAYAELHMHPWDCLAGLLLVQEAGGTICDFLESGGLTAGGGVLAATPGIAALMTAATGITCK
ncbi:inositol monophosphatase family protein [Pelagibacterium lentulum]|uniref:Inositol-1-monophosphatase n=1 Tax=Pelagibacterium lentulum TaxID=2029865 RepID=A0A916W2B7_9HYPH|nr:inositol monophosphatase family protein [Pelagibacterium lentulum]GGA61828.1 inositol monophosphatase [Pelagibacterium lentulum]